MKKIIVSVSMIVGMLLLSGCGGSSSSGSNNSGSNTGTSTKFYGENCITTREYIKFSKNILLSNSWYENITYAYSSGIYDIDTKYTFKNNGIVEEANPDDDTVRTEQTYEIIDGALVIDYNNFSRLFIIQRILPNGDLSLKMQELYGLDCGDYQTTLIWNTEKQ